MWSKPTRQTLSKIPRLYKTENTPLEEKLIYLHCFILGTDWYITEYDGDDLFWGFTILNSDYEMAEWGYISFAELKGIEIGSVGIEVDCEVNWRVRKASEIAKIRKAQGWQLEDMIKSKKIRNAEVHSTAQLLLFN